MGGYTKGNITRYVIIIIGITLLIATWVYVLWYYSTVEEEIPLSVPEQQEEVLTPGSVEERPLPTVPLWNFRIEDTEVSAEEIVAVERPSRIIIESISVDHPVVPVGLNPDGSMEIPEDVDEIGWYHPGVKPGELGSAVLAGHVDSAVQGPGALFDLRLIEIGAEIIIEDESGVSRTWVVHDVKRYDKNEIPIEDIFVWDGDSEDIALITCGGEFDRTARSYRDNIVVYASLM